MNYKTLFIDAPTAKTKGALGTSMQEVNGDQLARDMDAVILEKELEGYELMQAMPIASPGLYMANSFTSGILLVFKKKEE